MMTKIIFLLSIRKEVNLVSLLSVKFIPRRLSSLHIKQDNESLEKTMFKNLWKKQTILSSENLVPTLSGI